jgi:hypothetical protein
MGDDEQLEQKRIDAEIALREKNFPDECAKLYDFAHRFSLSDSVVKGKEFYVGSVTFYENCEKVWSRVLEANNAHFTKEIKGNAIRAKKGIPLAVVNDMSAFPVFLYSELNEEVPSFTNFPKHNLPDPRESTPRGQNITRTEYGNALRTRAYQILKEHGYLPEKNEADDDDFVMGDDELGNL